MPEKKERFVKVCPNCGSRDFYTVGARSIRYACKSCGYQGAFIDLPEREAMKIKQGPAKYFMPFPAPSVKYKDPGPIIKILTMLAIVWIFGMFILLALRVL
jgi:hypothetical protein